MRINCCTGQMRDSLRRRLGYRGGATVFNLSLLLIFDNYSFPSPPTSVTWSLNLSVSTQKPNLDGFLGRGMSVVPYLIVFLVFRRLWCLLISVLWRAASSTIFRLMCWWRLIGCALRLRSSGFGFRRVYHWVNFVLICYGFSLRLYFPSLNCTATWSDHHW